MDTYYPYDPTDPRPIVGESHKIIGGKILLRHIPTENSLAIDGFTEAKSIVNLQPDKFYCPYSKDTRYRESTRLVYFNTINDDKTVTCSYLAAGTPFTANDANEIKAHIENTAIHGGGGSVDMTEVNAAINTLRGEVNSSVDNLQSLIDAEQLAIDGLSVSVDERFANITGDAFFVYPALANDDIPEEARHSLPLDNDVPFDDAVWSGDDFASVENTFANCFGRAAKLGDIIHWTHTSIRGFGHAIRTANAWVNLDGGSHYTAERWEQICPLLTWADRKKLDALTNYELPTAAANIKGGIKIGAGLEMDGDTLNVKQTTFTLGTTPSTVEGAMWLTVG